MNVTLYSVRPNRSRAFTLLELLLCIAVVALLIAIIVPALRNVRSRSLAVKTLASLRDSNSVINLYANDWKDRFPDFATPGDGPTIIPLSDGDTYEMQLYFLSGLSWNFPLADGYLQGNPFLASAFPAEQIVNNRGGGSPFELSCAFFTDPAAWRSETRQGISQLRGTSRYEVTFPSKKGLLESTYHAFTDKQQPPTPISTVDGGALEVALEEFRPGYASGEQGLPGTFHFFNPYRTLHTVSGVRGRDLR